MKFHNAIYLEVVRPVSSSNYSTKADISIMLSSEGNNILMLTVRTFSLRAAAVTIVFQ